VLILDTDHLSEFDRGSRSGQKLSERLAASGEEVAATIVSAEEQLRGWLAQIHRLNTDPHGQVTAYNRLLGRLEFYGSWTVLPWNESAADRFVTLRKQGVRIGPMDLKIACIVLEHNARLLTCNTADFLKVPGLRWDNWLE
jgi:tRNA(fMet)-specific endonuclease VapC